MSDDKAAVQTESEEPGAAENAANNTAKKANSDAETNTVDLDASTASTDADLAEADLVEEMGSVVDEVEVPEQTEIEQLQAQLELANAKADEKTDLALRTHAEMENLRKRQARELEKNHKRALKDIAEELLPVRDTLELGVAAADEEQADLAKIVEGTELTLKMLTQALEKFNIKEVDPVGEKFDPDLHQAISAQEGTDKPANTVLNVMQKGYTLNDLLLRPAMVVIAK